MNATVLIPTRKGREIIRLRYFPKSILANKELDICSKVVRLRYSSKSSSVE